MEEDAPAFLTVTSLQLPDSPIPLIDSQAIARSCGSRDSPVGSDDKDAIMDELLRKVVAVRGQSEGHRSKRNKDTASKCTRDEFADLEECTQRIMEGPGYTSRRRSRRSTIARTESEILQDCICSEVSENLRINIRKKTQVRRSSRSPSPEVTHVIRIAMKYHGQPGCEDPGESEARKLPEKRHQDQDQDQDQDETAKRCSGVSVALDFTLNCSSLHLTSRDISVKPIKNNNKGSLTRLDQSV